MRNKVVFTMISVVYILLTLSFIAVCAAKEDDGDSDGGEIREPGCMDAVQTVGSVMGPDGEMLFASPGNMATYNSGSDTSPSPRLFLTDTANHVLYWIGTFEGSVQALILAGSPGTQGSADGQGTSGL